MTTPKWLEETFQVQFEQKTNVQLLRQFRTNNAFCYDNDKDQNIIGLCVTENDWTSLDIPTHQLQQLQYLNLSDNTSLQTINFLGSLPMLQHLDVSDCQLKQLVLEEDFSQLEDLYLQGNQLKKLEIWGKMPQLRLLDVSRNKGLSTLPERLFQFPKMKHLFVYESPILFAEENLSEFRGNVWQKAKVYLTELDKGKKVNHRAKMIVVGNGRVGKTSMIKRLQNEEFDPKEKYTHGITLGILSSEHLPNVASDDFHMQIWDFGGQEIFYATHQFFMTNNALYLLAWTSREKVEAYKQRMEEEDELVEFGEKWRKEQNWLENIRAYTPDAPIIMVQTHCDSKRLPSQPTFKDEPYEVEDCFFSALKPEIGLGDLQHLISENIQGLKYFGQEYPVTYDNVIQALEREKESIPFINKERYSEICQRAGVDKESETELLSYLNTTGHCVHYPDNDHLADNIYIDPDWLTKCVYALLNKKLKEASGQMTEHYIRESLKDLRTQKGIEVEQKDLLELLKSFKLIFQMEKQFQAEVALQKVYIYPEYLPEKLEGNAWVFYRKIKKELKRAYVIHYTQYLPENILINIISHYGPDATDDVVWKNGIYFTNDQGEEAIIELDADSNTFEIYTKPNQDTKRLQREICHQFRAMGRNTPMEISPDPSKGFIDWNTLTKDRFVEAFMSGPEVCMIGTSTGESIPFDSIAHLVSEQCHMQLERKAKEKKRVKTKGPAIYFSYAWGDDREEGTSREEIVNELYESLKEDGFTVVRDKKDLAFGRSIKEFMKELSEGDVILVFTSEKYFHSSYCMFELNSIAAKCEYQREKFQDRIIPIPVEFINFKNRKTLAGLKRFWKTEETEWSDHITEFKGTMSQWEWDEYQFAKDLNRLYFSKLTGFLIDINQGSTEILSANNFELIKRTILQRLQQQNPDSTDLLKMIQSIQSKLDNSK